MVDYCSDCNTELFQVYFGNDGMFQNVVYKRCMKCGKIIVLKKDQDDNKDK